MIKLILFYSEGEPNDKGINLTHAKDIMINKYINDFDEINVYTPSMLRDMGYHQSVQEFPDSGLVSANYKLNFIGFCAWKPLIIKLELLKSNKDDIIFYHDVNCIKYPQYLSFKNIKNWINTIFTKCNYDFFFPQEHSQKLYRFCKANVIRELGNDDAFNYHFSQMCVNCCVFKNTPVSLLLLDEWIDACNNTSWLDGNIYGSLIDGFTYHCPEQSILNTILANWIKTNKHNIPKKFPFIYFKYRNINDIHDITDYDYLKYLTIS